MTPRSLLSTIATEWELPLSSAQLDQFETYAAELLRWNEKRANLTTITDQRAIVTRHFLDSLSVARAWHGDPPDALIDIGTGAGFPGLPLKLLWPHTRLVLVESVGKKTEFLAHVTQMLQLRNVEIRTDRAEVLGQQPAYREQFALVTARAVATLNVLAEYCLPLCRVGGLFVAPKSSIGSAEAEAAQTAIGMLGGVLHEIVDVHLPDVEPRQLIVIRKAEPTAARFPRRAGIPTKRPL